MPGNDLARQPLVDERVRLGQERVEPIERREIHERSVLVRDRRDPNGLGETVEEPRADLSGR